MYRFIVNSSSAAANTLLKTGSPKRSLLAVTHRLTSTTAPTAGNSLGTTKDQQQKTFSTAAAEPFLNGNSSAYVEEMYNAWLQNPSSVHAVNYFHSNMYPTLIPPQSLHFLSIFIELG